jgi:hypothetical protein
MKDRLPRLRGFTMPSPPAPLPKGERRNSQNFIYNLHFAILIAIFLGNLPVASAGPALEAMIELSFQGRMIEGVPVSWNENMVHLLGRDGRLWDIEPDSAKEFKQTADHFRPYSPSEIRSMLLGELGKEYEVNGTSHYLVAHPKGQSDKWARRFEDLYRSFVSYFSLRGFRCSAPPFPLIGIVCRNQREFQDLSPEKDMTVSNGVLGFYNWKSNRIMLYDMGGAANSSVWQNNASVIIHEAAHQTAFNTGEHSRYCPPPVWLAEGLATMFEAPGVYDAHDHPQLSERINRTRLHDFRMLLENRHRPELLRSMIASDQIFGINTQAAYAEAWAFSFYLVEKEPRKYVQYLALTAARPPFSEYSAAQRTADFTGVFGSNWRMLEAQFLRFMRDIK